MKSKTFITILLSSLLLVACGGTEKKSDKEVVDAPIVEEEVAAPEEKDGEDIQPELSTQESEEASDFNLFGDEPVPEKGGVINVDQIKAIIEYHGLGEDDKLVEVVLNDGEITTTIEVQAVEGLPALSAEIVYSSMGNELLLHNGWEVLTVNFVGIGTVSMNRSEQKDDGVGPYFPTAEIAKRLGGE